MAKRKDTRTADDRYIQRRNYRRRNSARLMKLRQKRYNAGHRAFVISLKEANPCTDCNVRFPWFIMEFDHARGVKRFAIGEMTSRSIKSILEEVAKCDIICANCHRTRTHNRGYKPGGWFNGKR